MINLAPDPIVTENDLIQSITRESFYEFVKEFWYEAVAEDPVWNWHIKYLCDELQRIAERVFRRQRKKHDLIINISPGSTKSTIASVMFPAWVWTRQASARCICASYTAPLAMDLSRRCRDIVLSEKYRGVFNIHIRDDQSAKGLFMNTKKGSRKAVGAGNQITGNHAHFIIVDDPIDPLGATSEADIKKTNTWMTETLSSRKVDKAITPTILIMQRLHQNDPSGYLLDKAKRGKMKIKHICLPAEIQGGYEIKPSRLSEYYKDGLMDPIRLDRQILTESLEVLGQYGYAGQYGQSPIPAGGGMFKSQKIHIEEPPKRFKKVVRYWDKAGTQGGGAHTAGPKLGLDYRGRYWILDMVRDQWDSAHRETMIKRTAQLDLKLHGKTLTTMTEQEPGSGGKESAEATVKNLAGFRVVIDIPKGNKVFRADPFSVQVNYGNVYMKPGPWNEDFLTEARYFPNSKFKDQIDAASAAFAYLSKGNKKAGAL